jgi:hypothetical protein
MYANVSGGGQLPILAMVHGYQKRDEIAATLTSSRLAVADTHGKGLLGKRPEGSQYRQPVTDLASKPTLLIISLCFLKVRSATAMLPSWLPLPSGLITGVGTIRPSQFTVEKILLAKRILRHMISWLLQFASLPRPHRRPQIALTRTSMAGYTEKLLSGSWYCARSFDINQGWRSVEEAIEGDKVSRGSI